MSLTLSRTQLVKWLVLFISWVYSVVFGWEMLACWWMRGIPRFFLIGKRNFINSRKKQLQRDNKNLDKKALLISNKYVKLTHTTNLNMSKPKPKYELILEWNSEITKLLLSDSIQTEKSNRITLRAICLILSTWHYVERFLVVATLLLGVSAANLGRAHKPAW